MFKALFKLVLIVAILYAAAGFYYGWWDLRGARPERDTIATAGRSAAEQAKAAGAQIAERTAEVTKDAREALSDGALTAKIKAKMALDDSVKALNLNVDTTNHVVTVTGTVRTAAERDRALALARETDGVRQVVDRVVLPR